jgi:hypothetical protein
MSFENNTQDLEGTELGPKSKEQEQKALRVVGYTLLLIAVPVLVVVIWRWLHLLR